MSTAEELAALEKQTAALEKRIAAVEQLCLNLLLTEKVDQTTAKQSSISTPRTPTVKEAIIQALKESDRNLTTLEIEVMAGRLLGRPLSKQAVSRYLAVAARSNEVERVTEGLYRIADCSMR